MLFIEVLLNYSVNKKYIYNVISVVLSLFMILVMAFITFFRVKNK